jgi:hypothetical protein
LRFDFFARPPRLSVSDLEGIWRGAQSQELPYLDKESLIKQKLTDRLKDYAVIGELVRTLDNPQTILRYSQSAADVLELLSKHPELKNRLPQLRPVLAGLDFLRTDAELEIRLAIERERYGLMQENLRRISFFSSAGTEWGKHWPALQQRLAGLDLVQAHAILIKEAARLLPKQVLPDEAGNEAYKRH